MHKHFESKLHIILLQFQKHLSFSTENVPRDIKTSQIVIIQRKNLTNPNTWPATYHEFEKGTE